MSIVSSLYPVYSDRAAVAVSVSAQRSPSSAPINAGEHQCVNFWAKTIGFTATGGVSDTVVRLLSHSKRRRTRHLNAATYGGVFRQLEVFVNHVNPRVDKNWREREVVVKSLTGLLGYL
ncbi:hypothetical protein ACH5RR_020240 [Cinchona calisaya]|uniref:Uncharacterized protein n=1 Tax=Cinchona calisaya TaxID=153742 RepID=A0ABD2ZDX3_9GENT